MVVDASASSSSIRYLYLWLIGVALSLVLLVVWLMPSTAPVAAVSPAPVPARQSVRLTAPAPASPLPAGSTFMAHFPEASVTVAGRLISGPSGRLEVEFEVPANLPQGSVEMWSDAPDGTITRWPPSRLEGASARLAPPEHPQEIAGAPREGDTYRYPNPSAQAPPKTDPNHPQSPSGTVLPAGVQPMNQEQMKAMDARYHGRP